MSKDSNKLINSFLTLAAIVWWRKFECFVLVCVCKEKRHSSWHFWCFQYLVTRSNLKWSISLNALQINEDCDVECVLCVIKSTPFPPPSAVRNWGVKLKISKLQISIVVNVKPNKKSTRQCLWNVTNVKCYNAVKMHKCIFHRCFRRRYCEANSKWLATIVCVWVKSNGKNKHGWNISLNSTPFEKLFGWELKLYRTVAFLLSNWKCSRSVMTNTKSFSILFECLFLDTSSIHLSVDGNKGRKRKGGRERERGNERKNSATLSCKK